MKNKIEKKMEMTNDEVNGRIIYLFWGFTNPKYILTCILEWGQGTRFLAMHDIRFVTNQLSMIIFHGRTMGAYVTGILGPTSQAQTLIIPSWQNNKKCFINELIYAALQNSEQDIL